MNSPTFTDYINRSLIIYGDIFDFSKSIFVNGTTPIIIICKICEYEFDRLPTDHARKHGDKYHGCLNCGIKKRTATLTKSYEQFVIDANKKHGIGRYDYSEFEYTNTETKSKVNCNACHNSFYITPHSHLIGRGCAICAGNKTYTREKFIFEATKTHNNQYGYDMFIWINYKTKGTILCYAHGPFEQTPANHLVGKGCPFCVHTVSKPEIAWLNHLNIPQENRQIIIQVGNKRYKIDAQDPFNPLILYEFNGDYWHGNPSKFDHNDINKRTKTTFGELYNKTLEKKAALECAGYTVISIWESDWKKQQKDRNK